MSGEITGREFICGLKKGSAWHTPVACGAGDGLLILSDGIKVGVAAELDDSAGQPWVTEADAGEESVAGSLEAYMRYEGFDLAIALVMGVAGVPSQLGGTAAYENTYNLSSNIKGIFATLAEKKLANTVWEFPSIKLHGFKLSGEMNKPIKLSLNGICDKLDRASTTNDATSIAAVTVPDSKNRILMNKNTVFRMNDQDDIALAGGDEVYPSSFEFSFDRPMDSEAVAGQDGVDEPDDNGFPTCSLSLKFPRYDSANNTFFDDWDAFKSKKMDITFTGKLVDTGYNYTFRILLSNLKVDNPEAPLSGPVKIPMSMNMISIGAATAPAGMAGLTTPMRIEIINKRTTDPLA